MGPRTVFVAALTLLSRALGLVRESLTGGLFGANSGIFDAFITAWRIPNLFRRLLGEGALSTSLQEGLTKADAEEGLAGGAALFQATMRLVFAILLVVCGLGMVVAWCLPNTMPLTDFAWLGADPEAIRELVVRLMPFVVLVCLTALSAGALNVRGHYAAPNWAPALFNTGWIAALVAISVFWGWDTEKGRPPEQVMAMVQALGWGVLAAGVLQLALQVPALKATGLLQRTDNARSTHGKGAKRVLRESLPLALGAAVYQVNVLIDGWMAEGLLPDGGPTLHYYANRIQQLPLALIPIAATTAVFPALLALGQRGDTPELRRLHDKTQRGVAFILLPAAVGLFALAGPTLSAIYEHGAFTAAGVERATPALQYLTLALPAVGASLLATRVYFAMGNKRTPVRFSILTLTLNTGLNVLFLVGMGMDIEGLALATAISSWLHLMLLLRGHRRLGLPAGQGGVGALLSRMLLAALVMGSVAWAVEMWLKPGWGRGVALSAAIGAGILCYAGAAAVLRIPAFFELRERLAQRLEDKKS